jgi:Family of unknown function (DUF6057)
MPRKPQKPPSPAAGKSSSTITAGAIGIAATGAFCLVYGLLINSSYVYTAQQPIFFTTWSFFADMARHPGGLSTYLGLLFSQCLYWPWLGAAVCTMLMGSIYAGTRMLLRVIGGATGPVGSLIPFVLLFIMHCSYFHLLEFDIKILFLCAFGVVSLGAMRIKGASRIPAVTALLLAVYAAAGVAVSAACLVLLFCMAVYTNRGIRDAAVPLVSGFALALTIGIAYGTFSSANPAGEIASSAASTHYAIPFLPGIVLFYYAFLPIGPFLIGKWRPVPRFLRGRVAALCGFAAIAALGFAGSVISFDPTVQRCLRFDRYAQDLQWRSILAEESSLPGLNTNDFFFLCRSFYHEDMFVNEVVGNPSFKCANAMTCDMDQNPCLFSAIFNSDLFFEMGATNQAIRWAMEAVNNFQCLTPRMLQRLTLCYAAQGKIEMARSLVDILGATIIGRNWARDFKPLLDDSLRLAANDEVRRLRMLEPSKAYISQIGILPYEFRHIWFNGRTFNKMAFEYSLALIPELLNDDMAFTDLTRKCRAGNDGSCAKMKDIYANTRLMYDFAGNTNPRPQE